VVARHFTELVCWQLSNDLKVRVYEVIAQPKVARDFKFCDQIRESARSAPRNISEGFGKYDPPEFARYLNIAKGSLTETQNHLRDGFSQGYLTLDTFHDLWLIAKRARAATIGLIQYLESCPRKWNRQTDVQARKETGLIHQTQGPPRGTLLRNQSAEPIRRTNRRNFLGGTFSAEP
jgi:four helix bundle protein